MNWSYTLTGHEQPLQQPQPWVLDEVDMLEQESEYCSLASRQVNNEYTNVSWAKITDSYNNVGLSTC